MPRRSKGVRLWLRPARAERGESAVWVVRDGNRQSSTGLGVRASESDKAAALETYLARRRTNIVSIGSRDPSVIPVVDVLTKYSRDKSPLPYETKLRIRALREFWHDKHLSNVTGDTCRAYAATRTPGAARRELEDLRSAINHHRREGLHDRIVSVVMPPKSAPRERWLTKAEAAHLILTAWRYRERQNHRATDRYTRRHVARFMLVARYMGSRAGVICGASIEKERPEGRPWIDLTNGVFYGRAEGEIATKKRKQVVRVPPALLSHLRRWRRKGQRYVVEWHGEPVLRVTKAHAAAVAAAGLKPDVTPHTWRHSLATWLMQDGVDPFKAAGFIGMSVETLLRVYGHHHPDHSADVHRRRRTA